MSKRLDVWVIRLSAFVLNPITHALIYSLSVFTWRRLVDETDRLAEEHDYCGQRRAIVR